MKNKLLIVMTLAAVSFGFTVSAHAATTSTNDKPRCRVGQVAKFDARTNKWACVPIVSKSQIKPSSTRPLMKTRKPARARPDLHIMEVTKVPGFENKFQVKVQNFGTATAGASTLLGEDTTGQGGGGTMPVPSLKPNWFTAIQFLVPSAHIDHGDRIKFVADTNKQVAEKNEHNNVKYFRVP